ncbi:MAG: hypothetical protein WCL31_02525, partial [Actinomycetes bacterium]
MPRQLHRFAVTGVLLALLSFATPLMASADPVSTGTPVQISHAFVTGQPPASQFRGSTKGDGWGLAITSDHVYNLFHHQQHFTVDCHLTATAAECAHYPSVVSDGLKGFSTPMSASLWTVPTENRLYAFAYQYATKSAGVVCMKTDQPLTPYCGFTRLSENNQAGYASGYSLVSNTVTIGKRHYAWNGIPAENTASRNTLMCYDETTHAACVNQPYRVPTGSTSSIRPNRNVAQLLSAGNQVIVTSTGLDRVEKAGCFDVVTQTECDGIWPIHLPEGARPVSSVPLPLLDAQGARIGVCFEGPTMPCVDLTGHDVDTPRGLAASVNTAVVEDFNGEPSVVGSRVYVAMGNIRNYGDNKVACYDFATESTCAHFPFRPSSLSLLYTTNQDPQVPSCIWLNADGGSSQIQNFDAYTTKNCGLHAQRVLVSGFIEPLAECDAVSYQKLTITSPIPSAYSNGTVTFENGSGNPISGVATQPIDSNGEVDLSSLGLQNHPRFVQFSISIPGAQHHPISMSLEWTAAYHPECALRNQVVTVIPTTSTTGPSTTTSTTDLSTTTSIPVTSTT